MFKEEEEYLKDMLSAFERLVERYEEDIVATKNQMASHEKLGARMQAIKDLDSKASSSCNILIKHHHNTSSFMVEEICKMHSEVKQPVEDLKNLLI
jgi:hypothetical protein